MFSCRSVSRGSEETDLVSVILTSVALAVSTAHPPTNTDQTVTEVSLNGDIIQMVMMSGRGKLTFVAPHLSVLSLSLYPWTV